MGWLIFLAVIAIIACIPLGGSIRYDAGGLRIQIVAGWIRFTIFPLKKKKKEKAPAEKKTQKKKKAAPKPAAQEKKEKKGGSWKDFIPLVKVGLDFLNTFRKKLRINHLTIKLFLGGDDPCDLAVNYGRAWASLEGLIAAMENVVVIQKRNIDVECDFTSCETTVSAGFDLTITIGRMAVMGIKYGYLAIRELLKLKKKRKAAQLHD